MSSPQATMNRRVWRMAWPIVVSNVSVPLLGAVDTAVVGHLPDPSFIGAVAIGAMIFTFIFHGFNCLRMGTTGPTAQARGIGDMGEVRAMLGRALFLAGTIGCAVVVLQLPIVGLAFSAIDASSGVESLGREYFLIRVWAMPASLASFAFIGWFYGLHDSRIPLVLQLFTNAVNIGLDFLFVFGFGWAVAGVAAATLIAEYLGFLLAIILVVRRLRRLPAGANAARIFEPAQFRKMMAVNTDIFLRTMCVVSGFAVFMAQSARFGDITLAANQVLYTFAHFMTFGLDAFAHAAEALVGEAVGRRDRDAFRRAVRGAFLWAGITAVGCAAVYAVFGSWVIAVMTTIPEVRAAAADYLLWAVVSPLIAVWAYTYDGVYLGATRTRFLRNAMLLSFIPYMAVVFLLMPVIGNHALWLGLMVFLGCRAIAQVIGYNALVRSIG
ncbi:MAG: MATE family efflux transporter [Rhodospirillaceae bacterium]|nr:MATE family efflux transporter [Rhodospirillaceae bacterium]